MPSPLHDPRRYTCPGEPGEISRSIHLARLAASYSKCRNCPHQNDVGTLPLVEQEGPLCEASAAALSDQDQVVRTPGGFRGIYLNQLDRNAAIRWAAALGALLWDEEYQETRNSSLGSVTTSRPTTPVVVIGYDERPASPDMITGIALGLQRMSCQVIDVGLTTNPCLAFAVHHLSADAGLYVTGAGCDPAWIGFDLRRRHGLPPDPDDLNRWETKQSQPISRPSRMGGSLRSFPAVVPYEANLWKHFHALRPLQVVAGTASPQMLARLERLFARLPGRLHAVLLPTRHRDLHNPQDPDVQRIGELVRDQSAHLGIVIDDDAMACGFLNEHGELIVANQLAAMIVEHLLRDHGGGEVVVSAEAWDALTPVITSQSGRPLFAAETDRAARLMVSQGLLAVGTDHRIWFGGDLPACDAVVTLAMVMQALSLSDADFSHVLSTTRGFGDGLSTESNARDRVARP